MEPQKTSELVVVKNDWELIELLQCTEVGKKIYHSELNPQRLFPEEVLKDCKPFRLTILCSETSPFASIFEWLKIIEMHGSESLISLLETYKTVERTNDSLTIQINY